MKTTLLPAYLIFSFLLLVAGLPARAQAPRYVISFTGRQGTPYRLEEPAAYLSPRALQRRDRQNIAIDSTDLPVNPAYIDSVLQTGSVQLLYALRWQNGVVIRTSDTAALGKIQSLPFVRSLEASARRAAPAAGEQPYIITTNARINGTSGLDYGNAYTQVHLHEGEYLHDRHLRGEGMLIAVLDAGFPSVDYNRAFAWLREQQKITATRNFTDNSTNVYGYGEHGTQVLSILAANLPGEMTGTAPEAAYILLRTEEAGAEQPVEEMNWAAAAELADSLGVDVISSSVGYNTFDNPAFDHTYAQLDGRSTTAARAAAMAARKGMIVVNSAGNEGNLDWRYLLTPADADSVLAVAAVNSQGQVAAFSSYGPAADGRIKPDVAALGVGTAFVNVNGAVSSGNGTSYACPVIAGLVACLWQAFPRRTNMEILQAVKASSSQHATPDNRIGYGIPNFRAAYDSLLKMDLQDTAYIRTQLNNQSIKVFPNPFSNQLHIYYRSASQAMVHFQLIDASGRLTRHWQATPQGTYSYITQQTGLASLPAGFYYLRMVQGKEQEVVKMVKY
ncbi:S8 family serine peptidase [Chitinophaga japonensis]|uniref:Putative secreted protein (Por secretion system target) n=1 Tax=Chitinophaga japonensis TaxID=104662 RepID=A0A562SHV2_CHIJA|nr:S8 family serine peptidase [Chitinophaga japonensis]TWI80881.1 putative secreted protein (Por secretion system target) [Chitinophaga japonensis]